ncbi:MAG: hypothetical protein IPM69_13870 [Ignavibacteria bacterium]|nr:hypothetical protein [Ignavibacteria bacterium]
MRKILLLLFVYLMTTNSLFSTDLKVGNILSPLAANSLSAALDIIYEIQNINILVADQYTGLVTIKNNKTNTSVFSYLGEYANLAPNSTRTVSVPTKWTPSEIGTFTVSITISFADDIDLSNNTKSIVIDVVSIECITGYEWNEGIGFIIKNNTLFPDEISLNGKMKPGDIIGVSCKVEDLDELIAHCRCEDKINSKIMSDFPDDVEYDWVLTGEGSIVQPTVGTKNSIFYKIPECPKGGSGNENTITVVLSVTIRNKPTGLKPDKPINGAVTSSPPTARTIFSGNRRSRLGSDSHENNSCNSKIKSG